MELTGWLFDLYACPQEGVVLWLLDEQGGRRCLRQPFPVTFYAAGPAGQLRALWRFLQAQPVPVRLSRQEGRELFTPQPLNVLAIQTDRTAAQPSLFRQIINHFPGLVYYDADIPLTLRYAARHGVFPLARCRVVAGQDGEVQEISALDSPWDLDHPPAPVRILSLEPDSDPAHASPRRLSIRCDRCDYRLDLEPARPLLVGLRAILRRHDPDLLLTAWGDTWLLPHLAALSHEWGLPLPLNRDAQREVEYRRERTYFSYGQVIHQGRQVHLSGRWHIDLYNAVLYHDYGLDGVLELSRVTALPVQTAARVSPGSGISAMQMLAALGQGILVPWHKQQAERPKTALDLLRADHGGLVFQPLTGLHHDVAEIDFISMYPTIMVRFNVSPETVGASHAIAAASLALGSPGEEGQPPGLVPQTLAPLLEKRLALKARLAGLPHWHPDYKVYKARASAHKWLLVTCFGYLGYKNARFGRIEAHEAVTAYGRETLLRAKEAAEDLGYTVLHLYVDGMWVRRPGASRPADFRLLLDEIVSRTGLPIALDGIYRWIAFLPSRQDRATPVANRYFGAFQDGSLKLRGIEVRRRDAPAFIGAMQMQILEELARSQGAPSLAPLLDLLRRKLADLRAGRLPLQDLLVSQKLSRALDEYRQPSPVARAVAQLEAAGKPTSPGQHIRFLYTRGEAGVHAWDLAQPVNPASLDVAHYSELLLRAASTILESFGASEAQLRQWLFANAAALHLPGLPPPAGSGQPSESPALGAPGLPENPKKPAT